MGMTLGMTGFLGFFVCIIWVIIRLIRRKPAKTAGIGVLACVVLFFVGMIISTATGEVQPKKDGTQSKKQIEKLEDESPEEQAPAEKNPTIDPQPEPSNEQEDAQEALDEALGGSPGMFSKTVRNDATGRWRLFRYSSSETIADHAVQYYNAYFEFDDEVHTAINFSLSTTSVITYSSGYLLVDVHEYVEKEEHDAKMLGGGMLLKQYMVNIETGEIEDLSASED